MANTLCECGHRDKDHVDIEDGWESYCEKCNCEMFEESFTTSTLNDE